MRDIFDYYDNFATYAEVKSILIVGNKNAITTPSVSIVMPVYNRPDFMRQALESALKQTYGGDYEIVVVDNNDTPEGQAQNLKIIESLNSEKILYYRNEKNIGMFGNWNRCIELARASYLIYCHDDDTLLPNTIETLMDLAFRNPGKAIFGARNTIDAKGNPISTIKYPFTKKLGILNPKPSYQYHKEDVFISSPGFGCGCLFDRKNLLNLGGFSPEFYPSADYALFAAYIFKFGGVFSNIPTFNYRIAENESLNVYDKFVDVDLHFRQCMTQRMKWPKFILQRIIKANYSISKVNFAINWGKKDKAIRSSLKLSDRMIMKLLKYILSLKKYSIS